MLVHTRLIITLSPACLVLLLQCTAAPVHNSIEQPTSSTWSNPLMEAVNGNGNQFGQANHGQAHEYQIPHPVAATPGHGGFPLTRDGRMQLNTYPIQAEVAEVGRSFQNLNEISSNWVHTDLKKMFEEHGLSTSNHKHPVSKSENTLHHDHFYQDHIGPSSTHHQTDNLWALVGESKRKFGDRQSVEEEDEKPSHAALRGTRGGRKRLNHDDPEIWRYGLDGRTIAAVHEKFRELSGSRKHSTVYKRLNTHATKQDALDLLSNDPKIQQAALNRIGIPNFNGKGRRDRFWGYSKDRITHRVVKAVGMDRDRVLKRLASRLDKDMATKLKSEDNDIFQQGIDDFLTYGDLKIIAGAPVPKRNRLN